MKNFTLKPTIKNKIVPAKTLVTYAQELDSATDSLVNFLELTNPNYTILNNEHSVETGNKKTIIEYYDLKTLVQAGVIVLCYSNDNNDISFLIRPNYLRMNRGIITKYKNNNYITFINDETWTRREEWIGDPGRIVSFENLDNSVKELVKEILNISENEDNLNINIYICSSINNLHSIYYNYIPQGRVIFSNIISELPDLEIADSFPHLQLGNYKIFPFSSAGEYYIPSTFNNNKWIWTKSPYKISDYKIILFNFMVCPFRVINGENGCSTLSKQDKNNESVTIFYSYMVNNHTITPQMTSVDNFLWDGFQHNILETQHIIESNNVIEEVFLDDEIEFGTQNFDNYDIPYYTIIVKNKYFPQENIQVKTKVW